LKLIKGSVLSGQGDYEIQNRFVVRVIRWRWGYDQRSIQLSLVHIVKAWASNRITISRTLGSIREIATVRIEAILATEILLGDLIY
jgi:hypothetical protein